MTQKYPYSDLSELNYSKERRIKNEQLFFDMNKRIKESAKSLLQQAGMAADEIMLNFACECSDAACLEKMSMNIVEFDSIHAQLGQYVIKPGHEQADIEEVMSTHGEYTVVRKFVNPKTIL